MNVADTRPEAALAACGAQTIALSDERYPPLLRTIYDPPPLLYVRGDLSLLQEAQLAVVGSRRASPAGLRIAQTLSGRLANAGLHICSGLALGIDGAAHRGALRSGGKSIAVMATGIDRIYPLRHRELAAELEQVGCLVTEFPPGTPPRRQNFPQRNRIISGLSLGVLVIEAALPSGSLITAGTAVEQGREVFALPWSMLHKGGQGCLRLIRDGAKMVQTIDDVLEELGPLYTLQQDLFMPAQGGDGASADVPGGLQQVLELVGFELTTVDELVRCSRLPIAQVLSDLSALELAGLVVRSAGGYIRC
ncbi:MAG: DNA-protecting protein DprA [Gammaproteobacteria bacterium]|nr:MAG: DNA-protecting protein DprA [Gammaproteobacteria bacterium]RLA54689.1 MAG: DNA-protecting protein DprA [Gammaproteobacteria bacterium]